MTNFKTLITASTQVRAGSINKALLDTALQADIDQITTNKNDIADIIASKGAANGIATLGADGKLNASQIPQIAISDFLGEVATKAAMLALTGQRGDWAIRTDTNETYMLIAEDATLAASWKVIVTPQDGVTALRNTSGSVTGLNGVVTLADVAFSGSASNVSFSNAAYTATNVSNALVEIAGRMSTAETDIDNLQTDTAGKVTLSKLRKAVALTGNIDGVNKVFTIPAAYEAGTLEVFYNGVYLRPVEDYTVSGTTVTLAVSPDYSDERPFANYVAA